MRLSRTDEVGVGIARRVRIALEASGKIQKASRQDLRKRTLRGIKAYDSQRWLLVFGNGFGDHVQFTGAVREVVEMFPDKQVDVAALPGLYTMFRGVASSCFGLADQRDRQQYDLVMEVGWTRFAGKASSHPPVRAAQFFVDLGLPAGDRDFRYSLPVSGSSKFAAAHWLECKGAKRIGSLFRAVLIHYEGATLKREKDLEHADLGPTIAWALANGFMPIVIGDKSNPWVASGKAVLFEREGWEWLAAVSSLCYACIGIDSGPGHVFAASAKRAILAWTGHHPVNYCPPSGNVVHLVPRNHESLMHDRSSLEYFKRRYSWSEYGSVGTSLAESLSREPLQRIAPRRSTESITLNVPQGLGDIIWVYRKFSRYFKRIDFRIIVQEANPIELRSLEWVKMLPRVGSVGLEVVSKEEYSGRIESKATVLEVIRRWQQTGEAQDYSCNTWLDSGKPLDSLCYGKVDWDVRFTGESLTLSHSNYITIAVSGSTGTVTGTWTVDRWKHFIDLMYSRFGLGNPIMLLGAEFDRKVVEELGRQLEDSGYYVESMIGEHPSRAIEAIRCSRYFVGYQSGLNIVADMYDVPQTIVYFDWLRTMRDSWVKPSNKSRFHCACFSEGPEAIVASMPKPSDRLYEWPSRVISRHVHSAASLGGWQHAVHFVVPAGIGDISWVYSKVMALPEFIGRQIVMSAAGDGYRRAEPFVRMLPGVHWGGYADDRTSWQVISQSLPADWTDVMGWGFSVKDYPQNLAANIHLEFGRKLKDWWPRLPVNYHYKLSIPENDRQVAKRIWRTVPDRWACVYVSGHNGWDLWTPQDWIEFLTSVMRLRQMRNFGLVFVGDHCDAIQTQVVIDAMRAMDVPVAECLGKSLGSALSIVRAADYYFGYPSGLSILANVLHTPAMMLLPLCLENLAEAYADPVCLASQRYKCLVDPRPSEAFEWFARRGVKFAADPDRGRVVEMRK